MESGCSFHCHQYTFDTATGSRPLRRERLCGAGEMSAVVGSLRLSRTRRQNSSFLCTAVHQRRVVVSLGYLQRRPCATLARHGCLSSGVLSGHKKTAVSGQQQCSTPRESHGRNTGSGDGL